MENQNSNKNKKQTTINVQVPSAENIAQRRNLIPLAFAIALVFFLFNFLSLQFLGNTIATFTGLNFVTGTQLKTHNLFSGKETGVSDFPSNLWAIIAFISSIIGLIIFLIREKREALFGATTGIIGIISLIVFQITLNAKVVADGGGAVFGFGYWGSLLALGIATAISFLRLKHKKYTQNNLNSFDMYSLATKNKGITILLFSALILVGIGFAALSYFNPFDKRPEQARQALANKIEGESENYIKLIEFKKQDGKEMGSNAYELYFSGFFQYQKECYKSSATFSNFLYKKFTVWKSEPKGWDKYNTGIVEKCPKGLKVGFMGKAIFEKRESGWQCIEVEVTETRNAEVEAIAEEEDNIIEKETTSVDIKLPFVGKKFYDTHPALSGSGTPRYFVEIKENGDVYFGYDAPNMNGADIHKQLNVGKFKPLMECKNEEFAIGRFFKITSSLISVTDKKGEMIFSPDCCGIDDPEPSMEGDTVLCPCDSEYF